MNVISEQRTVTITSGSGPYTVSIGAGALAEALQPQPEVVIADRYFASLLSDVAEPRLVLLDASEEHKSLATVEHVVGAMRTAGLGRDGSVLAIGGGVVQDVVTLAAEIYMRGVDWRLVPTTLMSMVDSCIGGKSSINAAGSKNLVGGFHPPRSIHIDPSFIATLSPADRACGLLEAVKIAYCRGDSAFSSYLEAAADPAAMADLLHTTLDAKRWFIEVDEFDRAERRILNFGHTFGHALEAATGYGVKHGIAVGAGMVAALGFVARERALTDREHRLGAYVDMVLDGVLDRAELLGRVDWAQFRKAFDSDKKHRSDAYALVLPRDGELGAEVRHFERSTGTVARVIDSVTSALTEEKP